MIGKPGNARRTVSSLAATIALVTGLASIHCGGSSSGGPTAPSGPPTIVGSGNVVQQARNVFGFDGVNLIGVGQVVVEPGASEGLIVQAEDNLLPYLRTEVVAGVLEISTSGDVSLQSNRPFEFFVTATRLRSARLSGVGNIECAGMTADRLSLVNTGVGDVRFDNLDGRRLTVMSDGVGVVRTSGRVDTQEVTLSGIGDYKARRLHSAEADVEIRSSSSATVRVSDRLVATVTGSGCVYYLGDPEVEATVTGSGCVQPIGN